MIKTSKKFNFSYIYLYVFIWEYADGKIQIDCFLEIQCFLEYKIVYYELHIKCQYQL